MSFSNVTPKACKRTCTWTLTFSRAAPLLLNTMFSNQVENDGDEGPGWVKEMPGWGVVRGNEGSNIKDLDEPQLFMACIIRDLNI